MVKVVSEPRSNAILSEASRAMARTGSLTATMTHLRETFADEFDDAMADALARWCRRSIYAPLVSGDG